MTTESLGVCLEKIKVSHPPSCVKDTRSSTSEDFKRQICPYGRIKTLVRILFWTLHMSFQQKYIHYLDTLIVVSQELLQPLYSRGIRSKKRQRQTVPNPPLPRQTLATNANGRSRINSHFLLFFSTTAGWSKKHVQVRRSHFSFKVELSKPEKPT